jgi:hypothetical protein
MPVRPITAGRASDVLPTSPGHSGRYRVDVQGRFAADGGTTTREREPWVTVAAAGEDAVFPFTEETGFAVGYYLASGSAFLNYLGEPCGITFSRHRENAAYADRALAAFRPFTTGSRRTDDDKHSLNTRETIYGTPLARWLTATFGRTADKRIPDDVFSWGEDFCRGLLAGLLSGNGSKTRQDVLVLPTTCASLATQARDLAVSLGYGWAAIREMAAGVHYGRNCKTCWRAIWYGDSVPQLRRLMGLPAAEKTWPRAKCCVADGMIYIPIRKLEYGIEQPYMWDISVAHDDHTFRTLHCGIGNTEIANFGNPEGLSSFEEGLAETNPERLFVYESTAKGLNHWRDKWEEAGRDVYTKRRLFVGWWAKSLNEIKQTDRRFHMYGLDAPDDEEQELIDKVWQDYEWKITREQLAWYRWRRSDQSRSTESLDQNQPWYAEQAFVLTGFSFFQIRLLQNQFAAIQDADPPVVFEGFRFFLGNDFFASRMEKITEQERLHEVELRVWEQPSADATYVIGCDPAMGRSDQNDRHAISVWRCFADRLVQVAEYADNRVETRQAAWVLAYLAGAYKNCMINLEITGGYGQTVMTELDNIRQQLRSELYSDRVAERKWTDMMELARWYLYHKPDNPGAGYVYNWNSTFDAKNRMLSGFRDAHVTLALVIRSVPLLHEMAIVVQDGGTVGAPAKAKDDRVFAAALACEAWNRWYRPAMLASGYSYEIVMMREAGETTAAHNLLTRLVQQTLTRMADSDETEGVDPYRKYLAERGWQL